MIKNILNKLPRKQSKSVENRDGGVSISSSKVPTTVKSNKISSSNTKAPVPNGTYSVTEYGAIEDGIAKAQLSFNDVPISEKQNLFLRKLSLCCVVLDFTDPTKNLNEKDIKRQILIEIVDYVASASGKFSEIAMQEFIRMVSVNLFRTLLSQPRENKVLQSFEVEEAEPLIDPSWPHLQIVYECLLKLVTSPGMDTKLAKRYISRNFIVKLLDLFNSEDPREREYLKTVLHRIYGKFMVYRPFIRKVINDIFCRFTFETERYNGIAELLEILGSIINGLALPLKEEHKLFLVRALIPLHKPKCVSVYHQQLTYCITQFVEKDCKLADTVIRCLLKYWPVTNSSKEVMFLSEVEEVLEATQPAEFLRCMIPLFRQIARCLHSSNFQVAERALFLWNNDRVSNLVNQNRKVILPIIFCSLEKNGRSHWNQSVKSLTLNVCKIFSESDPELFAECSLKFKEDEAQEEEVKRKREEVWKRLEKIASSNEAATTRLSEDR